MSYFRFIRDIDENRPIRIFGDGTQKRDFTFVDDIARGTISALEIEGVHVCNLGGGGSLQPINRLIDIIETTLKKKALKVFADSDVSDLPITSADISKARDLLHWAPTVQFEEGMIETIKWHLTHRTFVQSLRIV